LKRAFDRNGNEKKGGPKSSGLLQKKSLTVERKDGEKGKKTVLPCRRKDDGKGILLDGGNTSRKGGGGPSP